LTTHDPSEQRPGSRSSRRDQPVGALGEGEESLRSILAAEQTLRLTEFSINRVTDMMSWISYAREELLAKSVWEVDPRIAGGWHAEWLKLKKHGSLTFESIHRTKTGDIFPVEMTGNHIVFEGQE
jgi:hypothetical protein